MIAMEQERGFWGRVRDGWKRLRKRLPNPFPDPISIIQRLPGLMPWMGYMKADKNRVLRMKHGGRED